MKRIFLLVALFLVAGLELWQVFDSRSQKNSGKYVEMTKEATTTGTITQGEIATVRYVIDGDTIELTDGRRVRYIGIDAPEVAHGDTKEECFGGQAQEENRKKVYGRKVRLEKDNSETDSYGRLLRYVFVDDAFVNEQLVSGGFARVWSVAPDEKYRDQLFAVQQEARASNRGLWRACR